MPERVNLLIEYKRKDLTACRQGSYSKALLTSEAKKK